MLSFFIAIGRLLWPFVRESVFGNASFKQWLRLNMSHVLLAGIIFIMFLVGMQMASLLSRERHRITVMTGEHEALLVKLHNSDEQEQGLRDSIQSLTNELAWTRSYLTKLKAQPALPDPSQSIENGPTKPPSRLHPKKATNTDVINALKRWDAEHPNPLSPSDRATAPTPRVLRP